MLKRFILPLVISTVAFYSSLTAAADYQVEHQPQVIERAFQLEHTGILKQKENGYLYVEVSKDFIAQILPLIDAAGRIVPPRHYSSKKGIGAHISVMYENERVENEIWKIGEIGQAFTFRVKELRTVKLTKEGKMRKLWLLAVDAPSLETLRASYGLHPLLKGHDFHITIGTQQVGIQPGIQSGIQPGIDPEMAEKVRQWMDEEKEAA